MHENKFDKALDDIAELNANRWTDDSKIRLLVRFLDQQTPSLFVEFEKFLRKQADEELFGVEEEPARPQDEDLITTDRIKFYRFGFEHRGPCISVTTDSWQQEVKEFMARQNYWPDVWLQEERGGYLNITAELENNDEL